MLPDVIDEATLHSNVRREELFYAFFVFGNKFGSGVTLGISTAIYKFVLYHVHCYVARSFSDYAGLQAMTKLSVNSRGLLL